jgi:hypothetical protein
MCRAVSPMYRPGFIYFVFICVSEALLTRLITHYYWVIDPHIITGL